jgi:hypothetical protein
VHRPDPLVALPAEYEQKDDGLIDFPALHSEARSPALAAVARAGSPPDSISHESDTRKEAGSSETLSDEWPGLTEVLYAMNLETVTEDRLLERLEQITRQIQNRGNVRGKTRSKTGGAALTVDDRLKKLHLVAPDFTEKVPLKEIGALLDCSASAFDGGEFYESDLKMKRAAVRAKKAIKRARGPDRGRDENRQVVRDKREHAESYKDVDDRIDGTWDERQGGRFAN